MYLYTQEVTEGDYKMPSFLNLTNRATGLVTLAACVLDQRDSISLPCPPIGCAMVAFLTATPSPVHLPFYHDQTVVGAVGDVRGLYGAERQQ